LAKELGKTVAELSESMTIEELIGWMAFSEIEYENFEKQRQESQRSSALKGKKGTIR